MLTCACGSYAIFGGPAETNTAETSIAETEIIETQVQACPLPRTSWRRRGAPTQARQGEESSGETAHSLLEPEQAKATAAEKAFARLQMTYVARKRWR